SPIWRRRAKAYSGAGVPGATSMAMIGVPQPASSGCAECVRRTLGQTLRPRSGDLLPDPRHRRARDPTQKMLAHATGLPRMRTETALPGWAYKIRTGESVRELSDWNSVTTCLR